MLNCLEQDLAKRVNTSWIQPVDDGKQRYKKQPKVPDEVVEFSDKKR